MKKDRKCSILFLFSFSEIFCVLVANLFLKFPFKQPIFYFSICNIMKRFFFSILIFLTLASHAQDPHFSQYQSTPLLINPALAGSLACGRADVGYRSQWPKLSGSYQTFNASYDQYFKCGGVGFNYMHDNSGRGTLLTDRFDFDYAPYIALFKDSSGQGKIIIQPGIDICYYQKKIDFSKLNFGDMIDPRTGFAYQTNEVPNTITKSNLDISAGLVIYSKHLMGGLAAYHLSEPDEGFIGQSKLPMRFVLNTAAEITCFHFVMITPSVLFMRQQNFQELVLNLNARVENFNLGIGLRNQDALIFSIGYGVNYFLFKYSYDMTISGLAGTTGGAHELHIEYLFFKNKWPSKRTNLINLEPTI